MTDTLDTATTQTASAPQRRERSGAGVTAIILVIAALILWLGGVALTIDSARLDDSASGKVAVLFWPSQSAEANFRAIAAAGGAPIRPVLGSTVWIAHSDTPGFVGRLRAQGARAAYSEIRFGPMFAGCFSYVSSRESKTPEFVIR